jgi:glycoside/pentoside/hexuronide:cation symporter, GPH family
MGVDEQDRQAAPAGPQGSPQPTSTPAPPPHVANPYTASTFQIHAWGATAISYFFQYNLFQLVPLIFNLGFGMDPRIVGWALFFPRVIDAFVDPVVGHLSDITKTRWGRRRPFMFACAILSALLGMALWRVEPDWQWFAQIAYVCVFVTMYFTVVMTFELTRNALSFELSDDYSIRSKIMAINNFWMTVPQLLGAGTYWFVLQLAKGTKFDTGVFGWTVQFPNLGSEVNGVRWVSVVVAAIILVFGIVPTIFIRERFQNYNQKHVSLWNAFKATFRNRAFIVLIFLRLAQTLGTVLYGTLSSYIIIYVVCGGDKSQFSAVMGVGGAWVGFLFTLLVWPLAAPLTRIIGKRWGLIVGFGTTLLSAILAPLITRPHWIWVIFACNFFFMPWSMMQGVFLESIKPDICDIDELESGERREGLYSAVFSFVNKLEISVVVLLSSYLLVWSGFDTKAAAGGIMPNQHVLQNLLWWGFTPLIFFAAVAFVITFFIPLTPAMMAKVHAELEERRAKSHLVEPDKA